MKIYFKLFLCPILVSSLSSLIEPLRKVKKCLTFSLSQFGILTVLTKPLTEIKFELFCLSRLVIPTVLTEPLAEVKKHFFLSPI